MHDRIDARLEKIDLYYDAASPDVREACDEIIPWGEIYRLNDDQFMLRFIRRYVQDKHAKRDLDERSKPLCRCADSACPSKRGELHPQILPRRGGVDELEPGVEDRVDAFVNGEHDDVVVSEAVDKLVDRYAEIMPDLTRAVSKLEDDVESDRGLVDA
jgi:hypothetical protein